MRKMKKKVWACLIAFTMVLMALPNLAVKVEAATDYDVRVGDTKVTSDTLSGEGWSFEPKTRTLTLDGYNYKTAKQGTGVIYSGQDINLVLKNENIIENTGNFTSNWQCGIEVMGTLTISGGGSLQVSGGLGFTSHGLSVTNLIVNGGTITANGKEAKGSSGIFARSNVTINGGDITAVANTSSAGTSRGIECGTFTMNNGIVNAKAGAAPRGSSFGIQATSKEGDAMEMNAGKLTMEGVSAAQEVGGTTSAEKKLEIIKKGTVSSSDFVFTPPVDLNLDGSGKEATVTAKAGVNCGAITVKYYDANDKLMEGLPIAIGTYKVKINVAGSEVCKAADDITDGSWTFTIVCENHKFSNVTYSWSEDNSKCTASAVCSICGEKVKETATSTSKVTQEQSCTNPEKTTYTATFINTKFKTQDKEVETKEALGHTRNDDDGDCTTAVTCTRCDYVFAEAKEHDFSGEWKKDASGHWKECQNESCKITTEKKKHTADIEAATEDKDQVCKECGWVIANKLGHIHKLHLEVVAAKEATCIEDGNKAYFKCTEDKKCFADENATKEINESDMQIKASGHEYGDPVYTWSEDNTTCTAVISCKKCQDIYAKEEVKITSKVTQEQSCTNPEITTYTATFTNSAFATQNKEVPTKEAAGHTASDWIIDKEATVTAEGSQHKECTVCKKVLETEAIKKLPAVAYRVIEGADGTYTLNEDGTYTLRANGEFSKFVNVEMDGKVVDSKNYTAKSGSTIITFTKEYMDSLSVGKHTVKVNFTDGTAETTLVVAQKDTKKAPDKTDQTENKPVSKTAKTGDTSNMIAWFILLIASACIVGSLRAIRKQRRR